MRGTAVIMRKPRLQGPYGGGTLQVNKKSNGIESSDSIKLNEPMSDGYFRPWFSGSESTDVELELYDPQGNLLGEQYVESIKKK